jgi:peptidoglycan-associated lipoprotein
MHIKTAAFAMLLVGVGCSHAQTKPDQSQAQALREPRPAAKPMTTTRSQDNEVASDQDSRAAGEAIYFDFDSALLRNDARPELQKVAQEAKRAKAIRIEGNCDERGTTEFNLALGDARARSAATYLERLGVRKNKISTVSYGSERPKVPGHDESAWSQNRRDDFRIQ